MPNSLIEEQIGAAQIETLVVLCAEAENNSKIFLDRVLVTINGYLNVVTSLSSRY